jgi:hypothetical protein
MPNGARSGIDMYSGTLYRTTGPAFDANPWNSALVTATAVGTATFTFGDSSNATFAHVMGGISQSHPITRQEYASPATVCR